MVHDEVNLHPPCPLCLATGEVDRGSFVTASEKIKGRCFLCRGKGSLLLSADELTAIIEDMRKEIVDNLSTS